MEQKMSTVVNQTVSLGLPFSPFSRHSGLKKTINWWPTIGKLIEIPEMGA